MSQPSSLPLNGHREPRKRPDAAEALELTLARVREVLTGLHYGSVSITVHESRVVQIDVTEKTRF